jgi:hypothetical protein
MVDVPMQLDPQIEIHQMVAKAFGQLMNSNRYVKTKTHLKANHRSPMYLIWMVRSMGILLRC